MSKIHVSRYMSQKGKTKTEGPKKKCFAVEKLMPTDIYIQGGARPKTWDDVVHSACVEWCGKPPETRIDQVSDLASCIMLSYAPSVSTIIAALRCRGLIYLCWGIPQGRVWNPLRIAKLVRLLTILRGARVLLVNDEITKKDILRWVKRPVYTFPYPVDPLFYEFSKAARDAGVILVPGDNDRDEEVVVGLARSGWNIVRVTRSDSIRDYYEHLKSSASVEVKYRISYQELSELYRRAEVVAIPLKTENHAAGQTAALEAVVSGAPLVLSRGRTSSIVKNLESVVVCDTNEIGVWRNALTRAADLHSDGGHLLERAARQVAEQHNPETVKSELISYFDKAWFREIGVNET